MSQKPEASQDKKPMRIGVALFPGYEPLDVFGPLEAFQMLSRAVPLELILLGPTLEPVSAALPASTPTPFASPSFGASVVPTHTYDAADLALDVLLVPGGIGTRLWPAVNEIVVPFIARTYPALKYLITVCTGSGLAAAAGVLDGKRATTNKARFAETTASAAGNKVDWVRTARYVVDGNCWTSAGVSAGIDCTLGWIAHVWGNQRARVVADRMEYEWKDDRSWDPFAYMATVQPGGSHTK